MIFQNIIRDETDYKTLKQAANISVSILRELRDSVKAGISAGDIDTLAKQLCGKYNVKPAFKGVQGAKMPFPNSVCVSVNDGILHGIPHKNIIFKEGDVVKVDFGIIFQGFYTDHCVTVGVGKLSSEEERLISTAKLCIDTAVKNAVVGNRISDISQALETVATVSKFDFVRTYCGHGIGKSLWLAPEVPSYVSFNSTQTNLVEGMVLCVENQLTIGKANLQIDLDGWTLRTSDGTKGAMFEHMVIVRKGSPEILTLLD